MQLETNIYRTIKLDHSDIVNDSQLDCYSRRLATCSSDGTINIYDVSKETASIIAKLRGHDGPVWSCCWSDPSLGVYLASCSYDKKVLIWKENISEWQVDYTHVVHISSVSCIKWAPSDHGLVLACGSHDGSVSIINNTDGKWNYSLITGVDKIGVMCLCWGPPFVYNENKAIKTMQIATGGIEGLIIIYSCENGNWKQTDILNGDQDAVRSVAWSTGENGNKHYIASAYNNGAVIMWSKNFQHDVAWSSYMIKQFSNSVWHVSFSEVGNLLSISNGEDETSIWKRGLDDTWTNISIIED